jgi:hypothetical protein
MSDRLDLPNVELNQPGVEVGCITPLKVDPGDSVLIGDVTITPSDASTMTVSAAVMNTVAVDVGGAQYAPGQAVSYTLTVTGSITKDRTVFIEFAYTTSTGDERIVSQEVLLKPKFTATGGLAVFLSGGLIESVATAPAEALYPGHYDVDTSGGPFTVLLREVAGEWLFFDPLKTTAANNLTVGTAAQTFNGVVGPFVIDGKNENCRVYSLSGGPAFKVTP